MKSVAVASVIFFEAKASVRGRKKRSKKCADFQRNRLKRHLVKFAANSRCQRKFAEILKKLNCADCKRTFVKLQREILSIVSELYYDDEKERVESLPKY